MKREKIQCSEKVWDNSTWKHYPCRKNATIKTNDKMFCRIHDPKYIEKKKREAEEKYDNSKCKKCWYHFDRKTLFVYCPFCGLKKHKT